MQPVIGRSDGQAGPKVAENVERMPRDTEAEASVLGSVLMGPATLEKARDLVSVGDFTDPRNGSIFAAMLALQTKSVPADFQTISSELRAEGKYDEIGGLSYLSSLVEVVPTPVHVEHYCRIVADCAERRRLIALAGTLAGQAYDRTFHLNAVRDNARRALEFVPTTYKGIPVVGAKDQGFTSALELGSEAGDSSSVEWISFLGVNGLLGRAVFTLMSARPKAGKTTIVAHAVREYLEAGLKVAWLTEEPKPKWRERIEALGLRFPNLFLGFADGAPVGVWADRVRGLEPDVIVVDTARAFLGIRDENDAAQVHDAFFPMVLAARELNAALLVAHHRRKADGEEGTDHAGSHAFVGECDIAVSLKESSASPRRRELETRSRFDETPARLLVELSEEGAYRVLGAPDQVTASEVRRRVLQVLEPEWQTTSGIHEGLSEPRPSKELVRQSLHALVKESLVERQEGSGRVGDRWRLLLQQRTQSIDGCSKLESGDIVATTVETSSVVVATKETTENPADGSVEERDRWTL